MKICWIIIKKKLIKIKLMKNKNFKNNEIQNYKNNHFSKIKLKSDQKLVKNQEEIFKSSNIEDSIKPPSNESYTKILHDNNGSFNRYNDKNIKGIKTT